MNKPNTKPRPKKRVRRNPLTVASQLQGKLGQAGYDRLVADLERRAA